MPDTDRSTGRNTGPDDGAFAHGPPRLKLELTQKLNATPDEVWAAIGKFQDMSWHPAVASTEITGDGSVDQPEKSVRVLHLKASSGDPTITEILSKWQPTNAATAIGSRRSRSRCCR